MKLEQLAEKQHEIWSHWMNYMFTCGTLNEDGSWTMPKVNVERWQRQSTTIYNDLTEEEKESDREIIAMFGLEDLKVIEDLKAMKEEFEGTGDPFRDGVSRGLGKAIQRLGL